MGRQPRKGQDGGWFYPPLEDVIEKLGLQEVEIYVYRSQNTVTQYIDTRPIMDMCLEAKRRLGPLVTLQWWGKEGIYLEGIWTSVLEANRTEGGKETEGKETVTADYISGKDTVVNITLGTEPTTPLTYAPGLELRDSIISKLGENIGR